MLHLESLQNPTELWVQLSILWERLTELRPETGGTAVFYLNLKYRYSNFLNHVAESVRRRLLYGSQLSLRLWPTLDSQRRTQRAKPLIAAPEHTCWNKQNREPEKERGAGLSEEKY